MQKITAKTHPRPETAFVDVDLLTLYRRLNDAGEPWGRAVKAGCLEFVAAAQAGAQPAAKPQAAQYRKMLRRLLELEATPPPSRSRRRAGNVDAGAATRAMPSLLSSERGSVVELRPNVARLAPADLAA